jgi:hypothetical protein
MVSKQIGNLEYFPFFHAEGWEELEKEYSDEEILKLEKSNNICVICGTECVGNVHYECERELYGIN